jgi:hypothetical protein
MRVLTALICVDFKLNTGERLTPDQEKALLQRLLDEDIILQLNAHLGGTPIVGSVKGVHTVYAAEASRGGLLRYTDNGSTEYDDYLGEDTFKKIFATIDPNPSK